MLTKLKDVAKAKRQTELKIVSNQKSSFDSQGSYTGVSYYDKYEKPVQDADDL